MCIVDDMDTLSSIPKFNLILCPSSKINSQRALKWQSLHAIYFSHMSIKDHTLFCISELSLLAASV